MPSSTAIKTITKMTKMSSHRICIGLSRKSTRTGSERPSTKKYHSMAAGAVDITRVVG